MRRALLFVLLLPLLFLTACRKAPDHIRYIPRTALSVIGINTGVIGKKITWPALMGADVSSGFDSFMLSQGYPLRAEELQRSGLDLSSVIYVYFVASGNRANQPRNPAPVTVLPLENATAWKAFLQKTFPKMQPLPVARAQAAQLDSNLAILWTDKVAFLRSPIRGSGGYVLLPDSTETWQEGAPDPAATVAALEALTKLTKEESIAGDDRFTLLARSNRDLTIWLNQEQMMGATGGIGARMGLMSNKLYKDMAMATTVDFQEGVVEAEALYYASDALGDAVRKMGSGALPKEMIARLPKGEMDGFMAAHIPLESFRIVLEKVGLIGILNLALSAQQLSLDDITGALTGDFVVSVNNFKTVAAPPADSQYAPSPRSRPAMDYTVALRLGKAEKVNKLLQFLMKRRLLEQVGPNTYAPFGNRSGGGVLVLDQKYAVAAPTAQQAQAFLTGAAPRELPTNAKKAVGNGPTALYIDFQRILGGMDSTLMVQQRDQMQWLETQRIFSHMTVEGGHFNNGHLSYKGRLRLLNQHENALLQLLGYANRMRQIEAAYPVQQEIPTLASPYIPNAQR